jgi:hypothetical protein
MNQHIPRDRSGGRNDESIADERRCH